MTQSLFEQYKKDIKRDILFYIILHVKRDELSVADAQHLAATFLGILEVQSLSEFLVELKELGEYYSEALAVYVKYGKKYDIEKGTFLVDSVLPYIHQQDIETALTLLKGGILYA